MAFLIFAAIIVCVMIFKGVLVVPENHRAGVIRLGRYDRTLSPGLCLIIPFIEVVKTINLDEKVRGWKGMSERELNEKVREIVITS